MLHAPPSWRRRLALALLIAVTAVALTISSLGTARRAAAAGLRRLPTGPRLSAPATTKPQPLRPLPAGRQMLRHVGGTIHLYPPVPGSFATEKGAPLVVMLHGMCSDPLPTCDYWNPAGRNGTFLVCPTGNSQCHGRPNWRGTSEQKASFLDGVLDAVARRYGQHLAAPGRGILMGFSRGAFVARDVAYARPGHYRGLILIGAALIPDAKRLAASGIAAVVLAAGDYDGARPMMERAAAQLNAAGLPARYLSTGKIWHQLPDDLEPIVAEAIAWIGTH